MGQGKEAHQTRVEQQGSRFEGLTANNTPCLHSLSPFQIPEVWESMVNHLNYSNNLNWRLFSLFRLWRRQAWLAASRGRVEVVCFLHWELSIKDRISTQSTRQNLPIPTPKSASRPPPSSNTKKQNRILKENTAGKALNQFNGLRFNIHSTFNICRGGYTYLHSYHISTIIYNNSALHLFIWNQEKHGWLQ